MKYPVGVYLVIGRRGVGKTTLLKSMVSELLTDGRQIVLVHDSRGQFPGTSWQSVQQFRQAEKLPKVNVFPRSDVAEVAALAVELGERRLRVVLIIDELDLACTGSTRFVDDRKGKPGALKNICHYGRHIGRRAGSLSDQCGVTLVGSARRPTNLHVDLGELAERIYFFASNGRNTLNWISETASEEVANTVGKLPKYKHVIYDPADVSDLAG